MIIIMPQCGRRLGSCHKNLEFFRNSALRDIKEGGVQKNIINEALDALDQNRNLPNQPEYIITMPSFTVDSNIDGKKYFREVRDYYDFPFHQINKRFYLSYETLFPFEMAKILPSANGKK